MNILEKRLTDSQKYTRFQIKKIIYLVKTISSDISKILIMAIIFHNHISAYLAALTMLFLLRSYSGGMHFDTYLGCFLTSLGYFLLSIFVLPAIEVDFVLKIVLLTACIIVCERIGPITSKYRPALSKPKIIICQNITTCIIFLYIIVLYIVPESQYTTIVFWVVILHTTQLMLAKLLTYKKLRKKTRGTKTE